MPTLCKQNTKIPSDAAHPNTHRHSTSCNMSLDHFPPILGVLKESILAAKPSREVVEINYQKLFSQQLLIYEPLELAN